MLLEITDIEMQPQTLPIPRFPSSISLYVQNRTTQASYTAASFASGLAVMGTLNTSTQQINESTEFLWDYSTRKWSFESGPYVGPAARLCVGVTLVPFNLPDTNTMVILRGRLVSDGTVTSGTGSGAVGGGGILAAP
jgi:hypothetical protein